MEAVGIVPAHWRCKEGAMTEPGNDPGILGGRERPMCPLCGNGTFRREEGKFDSAWDSQRIASRC
jgi:hypothetical protein